MNRLLSLCLVVLLSFGLFACSKSESKIVKSWGEGESQGDLQISAEIMSNNKVDIESEFEIKIGIGRAMEYYSTVLLTINAPNLTIIAPDETISENNYQVYYEDFKDSKYGLVLNGNTELKYFELFRFKYSGGESNCKGCISFKLETIYPQEPINGFQQSGINVEIYYEIKNGKIFITTERPADDNPDNQLT